MALTETINAHKKNSHLLMTVFDVLYWFGFLVFCRLNAKA